MNTTFSVVFRPAAREDEPALLAMMRRLVEQEPGPYFFNEPVVRDALRTFLADPALGEAWIFFDEKTPVGYVVLTLGYSFEYHGRDAFIDELYIEPLYRRQGLGRRAVEFVEEALANLASRPSILRLIRAMIPPPSFIGAPVTRTMSAIS